MALRGWVAAGKLLVAGIVLLAWAALAAAPVLGSAESPPRISFTSPAEGAVVHEPSVTVRGEVTVAPFDGPSPKVTATLNGKALKLDVAGRVRYEFTATATLHKGANALTVVVDDGNGGEATATVDVTYAPIRPTRRQCVGDKRGDSHDHFTHMDIVKACATRRGGKVVFSVTTAKPPPNIHDGFGNPAAPCIEVPRPRPAAAIETCGDARLRGWKMRTWPKVPFGISGDVSTWKVPLKYLPRKSFQWRAYVADADHHRDDAPNKGHLTFVVSGS
jgi:hypothetical protein